jgi:hypothetical protein
MMGVTDVMFAVLRPVGGAEMLWAYSMDRLLILITADEIAKSR